jgi:hypothetical protein
MTTVRSNGAINKNIRCIQLLRHMERLNMLQYIFGGLFAHWTSNAMWRAQNGIAIHNTAYLV